MRVPRLRFTVRRMMIVVAIVGVIAGVEAIRQRRESFRSRMTYHAGQLQGIADENEPWNHDEWKRCWYPEYGTPRESPPPSASQREAYSENRKQHIAYHEWMYWKYRLASKRPWLSVSPDRPEPE
jgi:hypothetical protein